MSDELGPVYDRIVRRLLRGKVVPVLGAGVNLWKRPPPFFARGKYLPSGQELADELVRYLGDMKIDGRDLARVSQYVVALEGQGPLENELHDVFGAAYPPTHLHSFLAQLSRRTREASEARGARECMLIVTTNYDDSLERAFTDEGEPYELVTYIARGKYRGWFRHVTADGHVIDVPNEYADPRLDQRTVIAKIHGSVDRTHGADSFVITEDHYIDYIARSHGDVARLFPVKLAAKLRNSHFLFLGYSLRDWNLRVMLHRLWEEQEDRDFKSWAIQKDPDRIDQAAWKKRGVDILSVTVEDFVAAVEPRLPPQSGEPQFPASA
ncbi:MAG: SIR2 family NAD-dependent protein deacylase [Pseudonocardiaceae bacterium]